jgi:hypothetical protein
VTILDSPGFNGFFSGLLAGMLDLASVAAAADRAERLGKVYGITLAPSAIKAVAVIIGE